MLNYLQGEWYRTVRRKYLYLMVGGIAAIGAFYYLLLKMTQPVFGVEVVMQAFILALPRLGFYGILLVNDAAFSDEQKHGTLRSSISYGISRPTIYFGKLLNSLLFCVLVLLTLSLLIIDSGALIIGVRDGARFWDNLMRYCANLLASFPLWLCGAAAANALSCNLRSSVGCVFSYVGIFSGVNLLLRALSAVSPVWGKMREYLPSYLIGMLENGMLFQDVGGGLMALCWIVGLAGAAIFSAAGLSLFRKMEVR